MAKHFDFEIVSALFTRRTRDEGRRQRGASAFELLLLAVPVCLLSMVISSKLAATSTTKMRAQWQAALNAQKAAINPCGGNAQLVAPWLDQNAAEIAISAHISAAQFSASAAVPANLQSVILAEQKLASADNSRKVADVSGLLTKVGAVGGLLDNLAPTTASISLGIKNNADYPEDLLTQSQMAATNWAVGNTTLQPSPYYFKPLADRIIPEKGQSLSAGAAFVCNEPVDPSTGSGKDGQESRLGRLHDQLIGWAFMESGRFY